jgi:photosystem II stability/assembly factor-like uncharacterized protein
MTHHAAQFPLLSVTAAALLLGAAIATAAAPPPAPPPGPGPVLAEVPWRMVGPFRGGRTRAVSGVPGQPDTFYVGAVNGGVWKTDDAGRTWFPVFDAQPTQSIGAIAVAPSAPETVYVGSGEGLMRPDLSVGDGVYRSDDGGRHWTHVGLDFAQQIPELAVDPRNPQRVFAAVQGHPFGPNADRGLYRSEDGGAHWVRVLAIDEHTGANGVVIDPAHPDVVYATFWEGRLGPWEDGNEFNGTAGGIYKSTDAGGHWQRIGEGLPKNAAQINLAIAPSVPERLYAMVATTEPGDYSSAAGLGLFRSDDGGAHWARVTEDPRPVLRIGGGDHAIVKVDPGNADVLYAASIVAMKSIDGGHTWTHLRGAPGGDDYQNIWISASDPKRLALVADQGALVTVNGGRTWSSWLNQPTAQLYHVGVTQTFPYQICSGQQESGSVCIASRGNDGEITAHDWHPVGTIEYGYVAPDPLDADLIYGAGRTEVSRFHVSTGRVENVSPIAVRDGTVRTDRTEPLMFSPHDPHVLYFGASRLFRTTDGGVHWSIISPDLARADPGVPDSVGVRHPEGAEKQRGVIYALAPSTIRKGLLWAGTDDGTIWRTDDEGGAWHDVTPAVLTGWSKVTQLDASHFDAGVAYASVSRLRVDDLKPYVYRTRDGGATWQPIVAGLPDGAPVNAVREDPRRQGLLYAATERAVWVSFDDGDHWESLQGDLPHTSMRDVVVVGNDLVVATHGRGFWVLDDVSRLRQWAPDKLAAPWLLAPSPALRLARSTWTDTPIAPDEPTAANPPAGAVLEYYLPKAPKAPVTLEILDAAGAIVRRYASTDPVEPSAEELARGLIPAWWAATPGVLAATPGLHRWVWDLEYPAPRSPATGYPINAVPQGTPRGPRGPMVVPGRYTVRLSVDGKASEAPLVVRADPRMAAAQVAGLGEQAAALKVLAAALDRASGALLTLRSLHQQIEASKVPAQAAEKAALESYDRQVARLLEGEKTAVPPVLGLEAATGRLDGLYGAVLRGDAPPIEAQAKASADALALAEPLVVQAAKLVAALAPLNRQLKAAKLAPLRPDLLPARDRNAADEE